MIVRRSIEYIAVLALLAPAPTRIARAQGGAPDAPQSQLVLQLSDALECFDRGSALLNEAPDEALAAFRRARDTFESVVDAGIENGLLYYNLGNTHLRLGEVGEAIADYRRAARLIPNDQRLQANLRFARSLRRNHIDPSGVRTFMQSVFFWHYYWSLRARGTVAMIGYGLFWLLLMARTQWPRINVRFPVLACLALWVLLGASVAMDLRSQSRPTEGVLVRNDVVVRKGNGEGYDPQFEQPLHEGVEFKLIEQRGGWLRIELADRNQGWVRSRDVELF